MEITTQTTLQWSRMSSRQVFGSMLTELAQDFDNVFVLAADVASSAGLSDFSKAYPDRFLNVGIAEQNMIGIAAGLAKEGYKVFATSFAPFASMRCFEAIRSYLGYMHLDVTVVGLASGLSMGVGGNTHYGLEDLALLRTIPGMSVLSPADCTETVKAMAALLAHHGPTYLRLTGVNGNPVVYKEDYVFQIGKAVTLREGTDVALIATGTMVNETMRATRVLQKQGVSATVVDMHTIKPLDTALLDALCATHQLLVTVEEHSVIGGLGGAVAEYLAAKMARPPHLIIGIPDQFGKAGNYSYLLKKYGLTANDIAQKVLVAMNA